MKILIIGGVAAGTKTAAKLKREDRNIDVTLLCGMWSAVLCGRTDRGQGRADREYSAEIFRADRG